MSCTVSIVVLARKKVIDYLIDSDNRLVFERLLPIPEELKDFKYAYVESKVKQILDKVEMAKGDNTVESLLSPFKKEADELGIFEYVQLHYLADLLIKYGVYTPSDFKKKYWGITDNYVNAPVLVKAPTEIIFTTDYAYPSSLFDKLSKTFPDLSIFVSYANSEVVEDCGIKIIKNGELIKPDEFVVHHPETFRELMKELF